MKYTFIFILLLFVFKVNGQDSTSAVTVFIEPGIGIQSSTGSDIKRSYGTGFNFDINLRINFLDNKLYIRPKAGLIRHFNTYVKTAENTLTNINYGLGIGYRVLQHNEFKVFLDIAYTYSTIDEKIEPASGYTGPIYTTFTGNGHIITQGLRLEYKQFSMLVQHLLFKPDVKLTEEFRNTLFNSSNSIYDLYDEKDTKLDLSTLSFTLFYSIKPRK